MLESSHHFRLRARVMEQLGEQLVKNENVALLELVKNSYDAGAKEVIVDLHSLDDSSKGKISIEDDGWGMDYETVIGVWLEIGTDSKRKELDEFDNGVAPIHPDGFPVRPPLGEKGIGRLGAHKLGRQIEMVTRAPKQEEVHVRINWDSFSKGGYLEDIPIRVEKKANAEVFKGNNSGTRLVISNLKGSWTKAKARDLHRSITALASPFESIDSFSIHIKTNMDSWFEGMGAADTIKDSALYEISAKIEGTRITNFVYDFMPWGDIVEQNLARHIEKSDLELRVREKDEDGKMVSKVLDLDAIGVGPVSFRLLIFDLDTQLLKLGDIDKTALSRYLKINGGIALYRDNVRLYEYGNRDNDWLELESARINNPSKTISSRISIGAVYLDRVKSSGLIEKASREGLVANEAFETLKMAIGEVLRHIYPLRNADKDKIRVAQRGSKARQPVFDDIQELKELVDSKVHEQQTKNSLKNILSRVECDYQRVLEQYTRGANAALGLGTVVHEIDKIVAELKRALDNEGASSHVLALVRNLEETTEAYASLLRKAQKSVDNASSLIEKTLRAIRYRLKAHNVEVVNDVPIDNSFVFKGNNLLLGTVVNILDNAIYWIDYSDKPEKTLFFTAESSDGFVKIVIADSGTGFLIEPSDAVRPFVTAKEGGMGIGLHLATQVLAALGGHLEFPDPRDYSAPPSCARGACVVICLPSID